MYLKPETKYWKENWLNYGIYRGDDTAQTIYRISKTKKKKRNFIPISSFLFAHYITSHLICLWLNLLRHVYEVHTMNRRSFAPSQSVAPHTNILNWWKKKKTNHFIIQLVKERIYFNFSNLIFKSVCVNDFENKKNRTL